MPSISTHRAGSSYAAMNNGGWVNPLSGAKGAQLSLSGGYTGGTYYSGEASWAGHSDWVRIRMRARSAAGTWFGYSSWMNVPLNMN